MSGWLSRLTSSGAAAADEPQPFQVNCECGVGHSGLRRKVSQRIICRTCGSALFVLPKNIYPAPTAQKKKKESAAPPPVDPYDRDPADVAERDATTTDPSHSVEEGYQLKPLPPELPPTAGDDIPFIDEVEEIPPDDLVAEEDITIIGKPRGQTAPISEADDDDGSGRTLPPRHGQGLKSRHARRRQREWEDDDEEPAEQRPNPGAILFEKVGSFFAIIGSTIGGGIATVAKGTARWTAIAVVEFIRWWTPLKLTALAIVIVLIGLGMYVARNNRIEQAEQTLLPNIEAAAVALTDKEYLLAEDHLRDAVAAIDLLERDDDLARQTRQRYWEVRALNQLMLDSLFDMFDDAALAVKEARAKRHKVDAEYEKNDTPKDERSPHPPLDIEWKYRFEALYRGKWLVMEADIIRRTPDRSDRSPSGNSDTTPSHQRFLVDIPLVIGNDPRPVELRADFTDFDRLLGKDERRTAIFGGQLADCRLSDDEQTWIVEFDPQTGFLWAGIDSYRLLGIPFDDWHTQDDVQERLKHQAEILDVKPFSLPEEEDEEATTPTPKS